MSKEDGFELSIDALEKLCDENDLTLSDSLLNLVTDVIVMVLNKAVDDELMDDLVSMDWVNKGKNVVHNFDVEEK